MPRVADLPPGWRHFTTAQKIDHLIDLDRWYEISSWGSYRELDPLRRSFQRPERTEARHRRSDGTGKNRAMRRGCEKLRDGPRIKAMTISRPRCPNISRRSRAARPEQTSPSAERYTASRIIRLPAG